MNGALAPNNVEDCSSTFITPILGVLCWRRSRASGNPVSRRRWTPAFAAPTPDSRAALSSSPPGLALRDRLHMPRLRPGEQLSRPADLVVGVADHLVELRDPADGARQRED